MKRKTILYIFLIAIIVTAHALANIIASNAWYMYETDGQRVLFTPISELVPGTYTVSSSLSLSNNKQANWMIDLYSGIDFDWPEYDIGAEFKNGTFETENKWMISALRTNVMLRLFGPTNDIVTVQHFSLTKEPDETFIRSTIDTVKSIGIPIAFTVKKYDQYLFLLYVFLLTVCGIILRRKRIVASNISDVIVPFGMILLLIIIVSALGFIV